MEITQLLQSFEKPPKGYGEVAFFWWQGDKITKEKLSWILDQLKEAPISGLQINYCHGDTGGLQWGLTLASDPPPLSPDWWELVGWFMGECKKYGIAVSLSDYTLGAPGQGFYVDEVLQNHPEYTGQVLEFENGTVTFKTVPNSLNPMEKGAGAAIADTFYGAFERHFPGECGKGVNYFFSDELNFNVRGNLWCSDFAEEFKARKGYDLLPRLNAIFEDIGDETPKVRLDYYDVIVQLSEENYFKPVFDWHHDRGMLFGCDHGGRGKDITEFGDYFRTMKWNGAPGNDQPHLESDIIKTKVSSSICHLYGRQRTWLEGFYSSGWGTSSAQVADAVFRNFALGHNLLSLHGLYYSMQGSMWEWAPPCNHYHMPYWTEMPHLLRCTERLSWLLSQGHHCCDVAIVYPVADSEADAARGEKSVQAAFSTGTALYESGVDFDFIDFESLAGAQIDVKNRQLCAASARYRAVVLPDMKAVRYAMLKRLTEFARAGGIVVVLGDYPQESDRAGRNDPALNALVEELRRFAATARPNTVKEALSQCFTPDFRWKGGAETPFLQHRKIGHYDLYMVYNLSKNTQCVFRTAGVPILLNSWTGKPMGRVPASPTRQGVALQLPCEKNEPNLLLFIPQEEAEGWPLLQQSRARVLKAEGEWNCTIAPTLDDRYGDYRIPAQNKALGPEIRAAKCLVTEKDCAAPALDDACWPTENLGFGPQFWVAPDNAPGLTKDGCAALETPAEPFKPYGFSWRFGMHDDPGDQHSYHGLKANISDDFIGLGQREILQLGSNSRYTSENGWYLLAFVNSDREQTVVASFGALQPDDLWVNHERPATETVTLHRGKNTLLVHFPQGGRTHFVLLTGPLSGRAQPLSMRWYQQPAVLPFDAHPDWQGKPCWFRFVSPPGMTAMRVSAVGTVKAFCNGQPMEQKGENFFPREPVSTPAKIALCVCQTAGYYQGGVFDAPITFACGPGKMQLGDWSKIDALRCYSGGISYQKRFLADADRQPTMLELGRVVSTATVWVNGEKAAVLCAPPFRTEITDFIRAGENTVEILVHNTLANQMSTIPTIYQGKLESGILPQ